MGVCEWNSEGVVDFDVLSGFASSPIVARWDIWSSFPVLLKHQKDLGGFVDAEQLHVR